MIAQRLHGERLHLNHGPMDVVLRAWGDPGAVRAAERAATARFGTILEELVAELPILRRAVSEDTELNGPVARRMLRGCAPFARQGVFVTAMAAVAGAVADELMAAMRAAAPGMTRAYVNDGGDIAVFAGAGETLLIGMAGEALVARPPRPSPAWRGRESAFDGALRVTADAGVGGVATSGRHGRSFSLGIADAVTVLARDAATADAAATLIANAVDFDSPAIARRPARELDPDSDLGDRPVTVAVGELAATEIGAALDIGAARAEAWCRAGLILGAALRLQRGVRVVGMPVRTIQAAAA